MPDDPITDALRHIYTEQAKQTEHLDRIRGSVSAIMIIIVVLFIGGLLGVILRASGT